MIGTFWNMCRACPSVPVDKLHSEYRSTYRWHEYTGSRQDIIRRAPQGSIAGHVQEPAFPRRKKHPELAYKAHEILTDGGAEALLDKSFLYDRARSEERWALSREQNSRRSKSEGPPAGKASYRLISSKPLNTLNRSSVFIKNKDFLLNDKNEELKTSVFYNRNPVIRSEISNPIYPKREEIKITSSPISNFAGIRINEIYSQNAPKKSVSMNGFKNKEANPKETAPVHKKTAGPKSEFDQNILKNVKTTENINLEKPKYDEIDGEFKSEYKKNFQPFNSYEYDEKKGIFEKRIAPIESFNLSEIDSPSSNWYKEVVHLRQKANQYRYRGWGTELIPDHIAQLYNNQLLVWEQVSKRSTLSALSLASTGHITREESPFKEEKENRRNSPVKSLIRARSAKAGHTVSTHKSKTAEKKAGGQAKASLKSQTVSSPKKGINQVKILDIKRTAPNRTHQGSSAVGNPSIIHKSLNESSEKPKRRPRPTSLITTVPSGSKITQTKKKNKSDGEVEDFPSLENEQIVKSPLEPTRVKSPEQIVIRSPEPVNWTVPLDTGKTFTVTQNIREGEAPTKSLSEAKAWTAKGAPPPPASISAPTQLIEMTKSNMKGEILTK